MKNNKMIPAIVLSLREGYNPQKLKKDIIAGIVVAIISLPLSIALAIASGASPSAGMITSIFAGFSVALLGGSRTTISGPSGAFTVFTMGVIASFGMGGLLLATLMAGIIMIIAGLLRLGSLIKYIPLPVITGFTAGIAVVISIGQLNYFFGLGLTNMPAESLPKLLYTFKNLGQTSLITLGLGLVALLLMVFTPKKIQKYVPTILIVIVICTLTNILLPNRATTLGDIYGSIKVDIKPSLAFIDWNLLPKLISPALNIAFIVSIETLLAAVVVNAKTGEKYNSNMELVGMGVGNISSALFGGIPTTSAVARANANIDSGGRTPISGITYAVTTLFIVLFIMPLIEYIPMTVFAAILLVIYYRMFNVPNIIKILKSNPFDIFLMVLTIVITIAYSLVLAVLLGTFLALGYYIINTKIRKRHGFARINGDVVEVRGHISYMNHKTLFSLKGEQNLVLDLEKVESIDATAVGFLEGIARKGQLSITAINEKIKKVLKRNNALKKIV